MITRIEMDFYETLIREIPKISKELKEIKQQVEELNNKKKK